MKAYAITDVGLVREKNQDSFLILEVSKQTKNTKDTGGSQNISSGLYVVADGMGGAAAGDKASAWAVETISASMAEFMTFPDASKGSRSHEIFKCLGQAVSQANDRIFQAAEVDSTLKGMGTTVTASVLYRGVLNIGQVGDSRLYRFKNGEFNQLTKDHSIVQELVDTGRITRERARTHPLKNQITRAVGPEPKVEIDLTFEIVEEGEIYLLCSDGLWEMLGDDEIKEVLDKCNVITNKGYKSLNDTCEKLVLKACEAGGTDNITVLLLLIEKQDVWPDARSEMSISAKTLVDQPSFRLELKHTLRFPNTKVYIKD